MLVNSLVINDGNVYCFNHIYEKDSRLLTKEINDICQIIISDDRYLIQLNPIVYVDKRLYQRDTKEFFLSKCHIVSRKVCYKGYGISIYNNDINTLSIATGEYSSIQIPSNEMNKIITEALTYTSIREAIMIAIKGIKHIVPVQTDDIIPDYDQTDPDKKPKTQPSAIGILIIILIPLSFFICLITIIHKYLSIVENISEIAPSEIHDYFKTILIFHKEISLAEEKTIKLNKCILCLKPIKPNVQKMFYEMQEIRTCKQKNRKTTNEIEDETERRLPLLKKKTFDLSIDNRNTRFKCGHVYHNDCLLRIKMNKCLMCPNNTDNSTVNNRSNQQTINESNIMCLLYNFNRIFSVSDISRYNDVYSNELEEAKDNISQALLFKEAFA